MSDTVMEEQIMKQTTAESWRTERARLHQLCTQLRGELRVGRGAVALGDFLARLVGHVEEAHLRRERRWRSGGGQVQGRGGGV